MNDAAFVGVVNGDGERPHQVGGCNRWLRLAIQTVGQRAAIDIFLREIWLPEMLAGLVDLHDVRVLKSSDGGRLGAKSGELFGSGMAGPQNHFEGDNAIQRPLPSLINHAHAAPAQFAENVVSRRRKVPGPSRPVVIVGPRRQRRSVRIR